MNEEIWPVLKKNIHNITGLRLHGYWSAVMWGRSAKSQYLRALSGNCGVWCGRAVLEEAEGLSKAQGITLSFPWTLGNGDHL